MGGMIQPAQLLALSLMALGASTLHGIRVSGPPAALRPVSLAVGTANVGAAAGARERMVNACVAARDRGRDAADCPRQ
jgi:hypothetical protein